MSAVHYTQMLSELTPHTRLHVLQLLGACPGIHFTSGRRSPKRNRLVGGVKGSYHIVGRAADFTGSTDALAHAARHAARGRVGSGCTGPEEILIHNAGSGVHLHVAW